MKVRNGFVSNSSSASYMILIKRADKDTIVDKICSLLDWGVRDYVIALSANLQEEGSWRRYQKNTSNINIFSNFTENLSEKHLYNISLLIKKYNGIENIPESEHKKDKLREILYEILERNEIIVSQEEDDVLISSGTTMHNSFADVPPWMRHILSAVCFELSKDYKIEFSWEDES